MISYSYDIAARNSVGQAASLTYPDGRKVDNVYDSLDRLLAKTDDGQTSAIAAYEYIGTNRVLTLTYQNGTRLILGYDGLRREDNRRWESFSSDITAPGSGELIIGFAYTHDRANNRLTQEKLHDPNNSELYKYRSDYEVTSFQRGTLSADKTMIISATTTEDALQAQTWTLDGVGNWTENTHTTDGVTGTETRTASNVNEIASVTGTPYANGIAGQFRWDNNGNLLDDGLRTYQWDALGRLHKVFRKSDGQQIAEYIYDAGNRRVRKEVLHGGLNGDTKNAITDFYYDDWRVLEEHDKKDNERQQYVYGGQGLDEVLVLDKINPGTTLERLNDGKGQQRRFYYQDSLFSVYGIADESGDLLAGFQYDIYGRVTEFASDENGIVHFGENATVGSVVVTAGSPYNFQGQRLDLETGVMYFKNRYYDVNTGRFNSRDPVPGVNLYAYVGNNPTNVTDPMGLECPFWGRDEQREKFRKSFQSPGNVVQIRAYKCTIPLMYMRTTWRPGAENLDPEELKLKYKISWPNIHNMQEFIDYLEKFGVGSIQRLNLVGHGTNAGCQLAATQDRRGAGVVALNFETINQLPQAQIDLIRSRMARDGLVWIYACAPAGTEAEKREMAAFARLLGVSVVGNTGNFIYEELESHRELFGIPNPFTSSTVKGTRAIGQWLKFYSDGRREVVDADGRPTGEPFPD